MLLFIRMVYEYFGLWSFYCCWTVLRYDRLWMFKVIQKRLWTLGILVCNGESFGKFGDYIDLCSRWYIFQFEYDCNYFVDGFQSVGLPEFLIISTRTFCIQFMEIIIIVWPFIISFSDISIITCISILSVYNVYFYWRQSLTKKNSSFLSKIHLHA